MNLRVLITAGGTRESVDDVRLMSHQHVTGGAHEKLTSIDYISLDNVARGIFGWEFAKAFCARGASVTVIASQDLSRMLEHAAIPPGISVVPFRGFQDLVLAIQTTIPVEHPDIILMSAAVSDYSPTRVEGKIGSDDEELVIRCTRNPKILDMLRPLAGGDATIVGFKLVSNVPRSTLETKAREQIVRAGLDYCIGNDIRQIDQQTRHHPILLVPKSGEGEVIAGLEPEVVSRVVERLMKRGAG